MDWGFWSQVVVVAFVPFALWQFFLQRRATIDQAGATRVQTIATIISWVQAEEILRYSEFYSINILFPTNQFSISRWLVCLRATILAENSNRICRRCGYNGQVRS